MTTEVHETPSRLAMPRRRGALSGLLLMLLGAWGALVPFVGPYFNYVIGPNHAWTWTTGRLWLEVLPGAAAFLGGLLIMISANRVGAMLGGWLAAAGGAWFVVGHALSPIWNPGTLGTPVGGPTRAALENVGMLVGLGGVILFLAAFALGRSSVIGRVVRRHTVADDTAAATTAGTTTREPTAYRPDHVDLRDPAGQDAGASTMRTPTVP